MSFVSLPSKWNSWNFSFFNPICCTAGWCRWSYPPGRAGLVLQISFPFCCAVQQPVLLSGIIPSQVQNFAFVEFLEVSVPLSHTSLPLHCRMFYIVFLLNLPGSSVDNVFCFFLGLQHFCTLFILSFLLSPSPPQIMFLSPLAQTHFYVLEM